MKKQKNNNLITVYNSFYDNRFGGNSSLRIYGIGIQKKKCKKYLKKSLLNWKKHLREGVVKNDIEQINFSKGYIKKYKKELKTVRIIKKSDYKKEQDKVILTKPFEITEEVYFEMLEVLPPLRFTQNGFIMSEFYTENYTTQFFKKDDKFYGAMIDYTRKETWH